jgi:transposase
MTKIHAIVDALGNPVALSPATGQARGITPAIPSKANRYAARKTDLARHRERKLIEWFFGKIKQHCAIATRCDKLASTFVAQRLLQSASFAA